MSRKTFTFAGALLVAAALVFLAPTPGWAAPGGHGGGFHGGAHFGGAHFGGAHFGGAHFGGARFGGYRPYYHNYGRPYRYYGYYPYFYNYGYGPSYYGSYPYYGSYLGSGYDDAGYSSPYDQPDTDYLYAPSSGSAGTARYQPSDYSPASPAQADTTAQVTVNLPAAARLWFQGTQTAATGAVREFHSPSLTPGRQYVYDVRASWEENGHEVTQTQQVKVAAGAHVKVTFPVPPRSAGQASAAK
jgi:uncharacterized protein (TIGR03000 family)